MCIASSFEHAYIEHQTCVALSVKLWGNFVLLKKERETKWKRIVQLRILEEAQVIMMSEH